MSGPYRADARTLERIRLLEAHRAAAMAFLFAAEREFGWPSDEAEALRAAEAECAALDAGPS